MSKNFLLLSRLCFVFIVIVIGNYVIAAQQTLTGTWKTNDSSRNRNRRDKDDEDDEKENSKDKIHLNFSFGSDGKNRNSNGSSFNYGDLRGLTESQVNAANSAVKFSIVREAGNIECEGTFQNGKGSGTFRFVPNAQFVSAMKTRGFDFNDSSNRERLNSLENRLFAAAIINVTTALADDLNSANFGKLDVGDLFSAAIFKVDSKFMREMKATGFPNLDFSDLVKARIFKIDAKYVKKVAGFGFKNQSFEDLVKMKIFKITPEYVAEMRTIGFSNLNMEDLVKMRIFKIDGAFVQKARAEGVPLNVEDLVQKRIGVWRK